MGANYHSACRAKSKADFVAKLAITIEEADESLYWLKMLREAELVTNSKIYRLVDEANQLVSILTASSKTTKANMYANHNS